MTITTTTFTVNDTDYTIPGDMSVAQIIAVYASQISGLSGMAYTENIVGTTRTITFSQRTGTKG